MPLRFEPEYLIVKYLRNELTDEESVALDEWKQRSPKNQEVFETLTNEAGLTAELNVYRSFDITKGLNKLQKEIGENGKQVPVKRMPVWKRVVAAASIVLALSLGSYFLIFNKHAKRDSIVKTELPADVPAPKETKAMITLANGHRVSLDSISNGTLATQGAIKVIKIESGEIVYDGSSTSVATVQYNTLYNPRGSRVVNLTLQDGSKVWLNAESSLKYPTAFIGTERRVEITGEAYFEVAHNSAKPFVVQKNAVSVKVLGTHFNVNGYDDEAELRITLLEGSVQVVNKQSSILIKPGQQARVLNIPSGNTNIKVIKVNTDEVMAWKNGLFSFNKVDLQTVLRQLTKWYDVDVEYRGNIPTQTFGGDMERTLSLSQVLKVLEKSEVHFKIEGRKIIIMP